MDTCMMQQINTLS